MAKGILKRQESPASNLSTPDSINKHVKWDEEKLRESEAVKMTIVKGQIDEPKTPFHQGIYGSSLDESEGEGVFSLKRNCDESESESTRSCCLSSSEGESLNNSSGWESSYSEMETDDTDSESSQIKHERFMAHRAQHYFMKSAMQKAKELIESDNEEI